MMIAGRVRSWLLAITFLFILLAAALSLRPSQAAPQDLITAKVSGTMIANGDVRSSEGSFQFSPDSQTVVFIADRLTDGANELYSAPSTGLTSPVRLHGPLPAGRSVESFQISPDSKKVVFIAPLLAAGVNELWVTNIGGGTANRLNATLPTGGDVTSFAISADAKRVVYRADQDKDDVF
jgi:Tol biopolymer transport system component